MSLPGLPTVALSCYMFELHLIHILQTNANDVLSKAGGRHGAGP